tara:strand:- start:357 stop:644 length:288 start_codon:yes stop_codon:yes gene_type:complete
MSLKNVPPEILELVPAYLKNRKIELQNLKELVNSQNLTDINRIGHKLAGNAGSYGLDDLGRLGERLEYSNDVLEIEEILNMYEAILDIYAKEVDL